MDSRLKTVRVWDLPTRVFHWLLAGCVFGSLASGGLGSTAMAWHLRFGYAVFALLGFRLVWGLVGGHWSRFANFIHGPAALQRAWRERGRAPELHGPGYSPHGGLAVLGMLIVLLAQVGTGLFADDEAGTTGPLNPLVAAPTAQLLGSYHRLVGARVLLAMVLLHLGYLAWRRRHLVLPMITGDKRLAANATAAHDTLALRAFAAVLFGACAAAVAWVVSPGS